MTLIHLFLFSKTILFYSRSLFHFSSREKCRPNHSQIESEKSPTQRFESKGASCRTSISLSQKSTRSTLQLAHLSRQPPYQINIKLVQEGIGPKQMHTDRYTFHIFGESFHSSISHCFSSGERQRRQEEPRQTPQLRSCHFPRRWPWRFQEWPCTPQVW